MQDNKIAQDFNKSAYDVLTVFIDLVDGEWIDADKYKDIMSYLKFFYDGRAKPDIYLECRHTKVKISIKSGHNPSIHQENFFDFIKFLKRIGISSRTIKIISFYHFGKIKKLSNNGKPFTKDEMIKNYGKYLKQANEEINKKKIIEEIIYRTIIKGAKIDREEIDYLYYGSSEKGFLLSIEDIYSLVIKDKKEDILQLHFGGLIYQPSGRREDRVDRYYSRIKWPILCVKFYDNKII